MAENWRTRLSQLVNGYKKGIYIPAELESAVIELMPLDSAQEVIDDLPADIADSLRAQAKDAVTWSDAAWENLVSIRGPAMTDESRNLFRAKMLALHSAFERCTQSQNPSP